MMAAHLKKQLPEKFIFFAEKATGQSRGDGLKPTGLLGRQWYF